MIGDAVIVDLRTGPGFAHALASTLLNVRELLDEQWVVHAWVSADANLSRTVRQRLYKLSGLRHALRCANAGTCAALRLKRMTGENSRAWYNRLILKTDFWRSFSAPHVLLFELDTCLCPSPTWSLRHFVDEGYSYIGAPWHPRSVISPDDQRPDGAFHDGAFACVGNSGLSLWRRQDVLTLQPAASSDDFLEWRTVIADMWLSAQLQSKRWRGLGLRGVPNASEAARFAIETYGYRDTGVPVGVHLNALQRREPKRALLQAEHERMLVLKCPPVASVFYRWDETRHGSVGAAPENRG
ncbi:hypothetical protein EMIHUDRAFT_217060 [Emiliania huxleyi CCMP1516]|uniref:DUF5672 domain-containing protein n=2 Tax=Emiliania huxleyi TaxID=2903 RepID=A0A0D3IC20_EMIH1|nr:hypothetical protein EMIHUDRAFT_217060 [Emiliania huxleyi CCMP1516]EOD08805.1 hypothetical protein EMIHUDRAFT_217060 [Emiliania huxleyi CCMP1516]|eukprot:XP_005761234.1 hypothetical protein EMIHUDRAFT_217060 [Emiliania huxleyi CCMP1516]